MTAGYIFLNMPVSSADKVCKLLNGFIKCTIRPFIQPVAIRIINDKTVKVAPEVVKMFNKSGEFIPFQEKDR
jgi:hypothetical protein